MRITPEVLKCVVFICRERLIERETKIVPAATGFLVSMEPAQGVFVHYLVTCRHVIESDVMARVIIRVNTKEGKSRNISTEASEWLLHNTADIAILPFAKEDDLDIRSIHHPSHFVGANYTYITVHTPPKKDQAAGQTPVRYSNVHQITTGDDIAAIGLFIEDYGDSSNLPIARFGNIARMPSMVNTPRWSDDRFRSIAYLAEFLAYPGLSGSPVFWFLEMVINTQLGGGFAKSEIKLIPAFAGSVNGYVPRPEKAEIEGDVLGTITTKINTGIATVTPAAAIEEMLLHPKLQAQRAEIASKAAEPHNYVTPALVASKVQAIHEPFFYTKTLEPSHEPTASLTTDKPPLSATESGPRLGGAADL